MSITAEQYGDKVNAYFRAYNVALTDAQQAVWQTALMNNNGSVWTSGMNQYLAALSGFTGVAPMLPTQAQGTMLAVFGTLFNVTSLAELDSSIVEYYGNALTSGTIKQRGFVNAVLNDMGLMPNVDGEFSRPGNWDPSWGPGDWQDLLTPAQQFFYQGIFDPDFSTEFALTTGLDYADTLIAYNDAVPSSFRFTSNNEVVNALPGTLQTDDTLIDRETGDDDVLNVWLNSTNGLDDIGNPTVIGIEHLNFNIDRAPAGTLNLNNFSGAQTLTVEGILSGDQTFNNYNDSGASEFDFSAATPRAGTTFGVNLANRAGGDQYSVTITGSDGADNLEGSAVADWIEGGFGKDVLTGGTGNDIFVFSSFDSVDTITDFGVGNNKIYIDAGTNTAMDNFLANTNVIINALGNGRAWVDGNLMQLKLAELQTAANKAALTALIQSTVLKGVGTATSGVFFGYTAATNILYAFRATRASILVSFNIKATYTIVDDAAGAGIAAGDIYIM